MSTVEFFIANVVAFRDKCSADDRWSQRSGSARARLRLAVDNRAFFAQPNVARFTASVLFTIQNFITGQFAFMILWQNGVSMFAANSIAVMLTTRLFPFANIIALEFVFLFGAMSDVTLYFSRSHSTVTELLDCDLALWTGTVMAADRTDMSTLENFFARCSTDGNRIVA